MNIGKIHWAANPRQILKFIENFEFSGTEYNFYIENAYIVTTVRITPCTGMLKRFSSADGGASSRLDGPHIGLVAAYMYKNL